jgi:hypothetical protein
VSEEELDARRESERKLYGKLLNFPVMVGRSIGFSYSSVGWMDTQQELEVLKGLVLKLDCWREVVWSFLFG